MPTLSYDGQSLIVDGRRLWLASGTLYYPRIPAGLWRRRIRAAKSAGLNCIDVPVFWSVHEPREGKLTFDDQADLGRFIKIIGEEGLYCILRPGPYINASADLGGLPAWLLAKPESAPRQASPGFLEATARFFSAVLTQVKDHQINSDEAAPTGGPIVLMQAEHQWLCHNPDQAAKYLREIVRYLREAGCTVPIVSNNNLWQHVDGTIDAWCSDSHLSSDLRQLRAVKPHAPPLALDLPAAPDQHWGQPLHHGLEPAAHLHRLAQVLAVGGQFNLSPFHGGTNFGLLAGRSSDSTAAFFATANAPAAPLTETGRPGRNLPAIRRIAAFASHFGHVLAHAEPLPHTVAAPDQHDHALSIFHQGGKQGQAVFIFRPAGDKTENLDLLLPDGQTLTVPLGDEQVAWLLIAANLAGVAELTATNLRPLVFIGKRLLVLFGPAGASGLVNINGTPLAIRVPDDDAPAVVAHEGLTVAVLNTQQADAACILPAGLALGSVELNDDNQPIPLPGRREILRIELDGQTTRVKTPPPRRASPIPRLTGWTYAPLSDLIAGTSSAYKPIPGPASLESLAPESAYGWYALTLKSSESGPILAPRSGDRLHLFTNSKAQALLGLGPGAEYDPITLQLAGKVVILAESLGRFSDGWNLGQPAGLYGHLHLVAPLRLGKPRRDEAKLPDPFTLQGYLKNLRRDERAVGDWIRWKVNVGKKSSLILDIAGLARRAVVVANGQPVGLYDPAQTAARSRFLLEPGQAIKAGNNELALAFLDRLPGNGNSSKTIPPDVTRHLTLYQSKASITEKAEWFFAPGPGSGPGSVPKPAAFVAKSATPNLPCWSRPAFTLALADRPLRLTLTGLSKGLAYLNGRCLGRYFTATAAGKPVGPQQSLYLPEPWLKTDGDNELAIFDEHGRPPTGCTLEWEL